MRGRKRQHSRAVKVGRLRVTRVCTFASRCSRSSARREEEEEEDEEEESLFKADAVNEEDSKTAVGEGGGMERQREGEGGGRKRRRE